MAYQGSIPHANASLAPPPRCFAAKIILIFSEFHFTSVGILEMKAMFDKVLRREEIEAGHEWIEDNQAFKLRCLLGDSNRVSLLFRRTLTEFIKKETSKPKDEDDDSGDESDDLSHDVIFNPEKSLSNRKIERLTVWAHRQSTQAHPSPIPQSGLNPAAAAHDLRLPREYGHLTFRVTWPIARDKENMDLIIPNSLLHVLYRLTGCILVKNYAQGTILVAGSSQKDCDRTTLKLDRIRKYFARSHCLINHLLYDEGYEKVEYVLKRTLDINRKLFKSTILGNLHVNGRDTNYNNLRESVRVRCAPYDHKKSRPVPIDDIRPTPVNNSSVKSWIDFVYSSRGKKDECPVSIYLFEPQVNALAIVNQPQVNAGILKRQERNDAIISWANTVPKISTQQTNQSHIPFNAPGDEFGRQASIPTDRQTLIGSDFFIKPNNERVAKNKTEVTYRVSKGLQNNLSMVKQALPTPLPTTSFPPLPKFSTTPLKQCPVANSSKALSQPLKLVIPARPARPQLSQLEVPEAQLPPHSRSDAPMGILQPALKSQRRLPYSNTCQTPGKPIPSQPVAVSQPRTSLNLSEKSTSPIVFAENNDRCLLDDDINDTLGTEILQPVKISHERQQSVDEFSTRSFRNTMQQQTGKEPAFKGRLDLPQWPIRKPDVVVGDIEDPSKNFLKDLEIAFTGTNDSDDSSGMMSGLQGFRGELEVQVDFGRIVISHFSAKYVSDGEKLMTLYASKVREILLHPTVIGPKVHFTKVLAVKDGDIAHVIDLRDKSGNLIWKPEVVSWDVVYEFTFQDSLTKTYFTVEINAESFSCQVKSRQELGVVYVHGTHRYHDFQISAVGSETKAVEENYSQVAMALERSLWIPANKSSPEVYWVLEHKLLRQFSPIDVSVRRTCKYNSNCFTSTLNVSEVQVLDFARAWTSGEKECVFYTVNGPEDRKPLAKLNKWHEVSITLARLNEVLKVNKKLELGEEAVWTAKTLKDYFREGPEDEVRSPVLELCLPACQMLKQMDAVGWNDENGAPIKRPE